MHLPIFLDTDPGIDDAVAIAAAIFTPELDLQLMTTVAGNVSVEKPPATPCNCCISGMWIFRLPRALPYHWFVRRAMRHLYTVNREWLAITLLNTTVSHWVYRRFWQFVMP
ncbi:hypothetical protein MUTS15_10570 [Escherichia coli]|nr:hypothetical protein MUTS15_10570 [Escherichia coli]